MRILLIKMSSMGDVFHAFPALTDAMLAIPGLKVDWVVEDSFSEIPAWHPVINHVYSIKLREWRKHPIKSRIEIKIFFEFVNQTHYDLVLDAQGLLKSAWVAKKVNAPTYGLDWSSAREPLASLFYQHKFVVDKSLHAIERLRILFASALGYEYVEKAIDYRLNTEGWKPISLVPMDIEYFVFLHGTTWETKLWPVANWVSLSQAMVREKKAVVLSWGTEEEKNRSLMIKHQIEKTFLQSMPQVIVPESKLSLNEMARLLKFSKGVVSVDTGLSHVAAALDVPMVVLYRVTDPIKIGAQGAWVEYLSSPLATEYLKKFDTKKQASDSLQGLGVNDVLRKLREF